MNWLKEYKAMDKTQLIKPKDWNIIEAFRFRLKKINAIKLVSFLNIILIMIIVIFGYLFIKESWQASLYVSDYSQLNELLPEEIDYCGLDVVECYYENKDYLANYIQDKFNKEGLNGELAVKLARCESYLDPTLSYKNKDGSIDRGLFMFNNKWHPEVTDECAYDYKCATNEAIKLVKKSGWDQWVCYKKVK